MICAKKEKGFTLIELLVVIAIIALLMAVLMPALNKVREASKKVKCQAQMRQYGIATSMYANDNEGSLPFFMPDFSGGNAPDTNQVWYGKVGRYMNLTGSAGKAGSNATVAQLASVRRCPSGKRSNTLAASSTDNWQGWIGVNYAAWNTPGYRPQAPIVYGGDGTGNKSDPMKLIAIKHPADWLMLLEVSTYFMYNPVQWPFDDDQDGDGKNDTMAGTQMMYNGAMPKIHNNGCNLVMVDGHAEYVAFKDLWELENKTTGDVVHPLWYKDK